ncbi:MAG: DUF192 domain-containing protein [Pseudomonadota bacterium]
MQIFGTLKVRRLQWLGVAALVAMLCGVAAQRTLAAQMQILEIVGKTGVHVFSVEVATTEKEREVGLMYRKSLPDGQGMLFDFRPEQQVAMWMKNTYIPLDMIFIRGDGTILRIAENTEPMSTRIIASGGPVSGVLEVAGGTAKKLGIAAGDRVAHPLFKSR